MSCRFHEANLDYHTHCANSNSSVQILEYLEENQNGA